MTKLAVFGMVIALVGLFSAIALGAEKHPKKKANVTVIDMSGPDKPESEFPTISKKGPL